MHKLVIDCTTEDTEEVVFTPEEIAQREYEASLPHIVAPPSDIDTIKEIQSQVVFALVMGGLM